MGTFSATANSGSTIGYAQYGSSSWSTGSSSGACQGAYQGTTAAKSRVGVMVFSGAGAALKGKLIQSLTLTITCSGAGSGSSSKKLTFCQANYQSLNTGVRGSAQVGATMGVLTGKFYSNTVTHTLNASSNAALFAAMKAYFEGGNSVLVLYNGETSSSSGYSSNYARVTSCTILVYCGDCGGLYGPKVWHSNDRYRRTVWQCTRKYRDTICRTPHLTEAQLQEKVTAAMQRLSDDRAAVLRAAESIRDSVYDTSSLQDELEQVQRELAAQAEKLNRAIRTNASVAQDQAEHQQKMKKLTARYQALQERYQALTEDIQGQDSRRAGLNSFLRQLKKLPETITAPDAITLHVLIERITVNADRSAVIRFRDGTEMVE